MYCLKIVRKQCYITETKCNSVNIQDILSGQFKKISVLETEKKKIFIMEITNKIKIIGWKWYEYINIYKCKYK